MGRDAGMNPVESLTEREYDVLQLLAEGHSNRRVAELLVLSIHTVKWYNRQIYGKLGVADRHEAVEMARSYGLLPAEVEQPAPPRLHLPATSMPLLGRERELNELERLLTGGDARLVSIVAPGGMGKTHLALEAAHRLTPHFADGAAFANLAPLPNAEGIAPAVAQALGLRLSGASDDPRRQLLGFLRQKSLLLVLDNFEHVRDGAPLLAEIVATAPNVRLLVTSRERLQLQAERLFSLQGLRLADCTSVDKARQNPAVELFLAYGRRLRPGFELRPRHLQPLRRILELAAGMPLAIILAASWLELLTPAQIATEFESGLDFLQADYQDLPPRQRSMRAVFASTWERLNGQQQAHFASLSVFRGGFTLPAAREIVGAAPADLRRLLRRALLVRGEGRRLEIHELARQFAAGQLSRMPSLEETMRDAHSAHYLERLSQHEPDLKGAGAEEALSQIEGDFQNYQVAWKWALVQGDFSAMRLATFCLATFYLRSSRYQEGVSAFSNAVKVTRRYIEGRNEADVEVLRVFARLLVWQSRFLFELNSFSAAEASALEALSTLDAPELEGQDVREEKALVLLCLGRIYTWLDRHQQAKTMLEECIVLSQALGQHRYVADATGLLGGAALSRGYYELAIRHTKERQRQYRLIGDKHLEAESQLWVAIKQTWWWPSPSAERQLRKLREQFRESGDLRAEAWANVGLAFAFMWAGRFSQAANVHKESAALFESIGADLHRAEELADVAIAMAHQGKYAEAAQILSEAEGIEPGSDPSLHRAILLRWQGAVNLAQGYPRETRQLLARSARILREIEQNDELSWALAILSSAQTEISEIALAREALGEAMTWANELRTYGAVTHVLPAASLFLARTGRLARALEIWERARQFPFVARSAWFADVAGRPVEAAVAALPADAVREARKRGRALDVWATVARLQEEL